MSCGSDVKDVLTGSAECLCSSPLLTHLTPVSYASGAGSLASLREMEGWPESGEWRLIGEETPLNLSDLTDGQVAWYESDTEFWIIQRVENGFLWFHLLSVVGKRMNLA
jgi:hypothetical protein